MRGFIAHRGDSLLLNMSHVRGMRIGMPLHVVWVLGRRLAHRVPATDADMGLWQRRPRKKSEAWLQVGTAAAQTPGAAGRFAWANPDPWPSRHGCAPATWRHFSVSAGKEFCACIPGTITAQKRLYGSDSADTEFSACRNGKVRGPVPRRPPPRTNPAHAKRRRAT